MASADPMADLEQLERLADRMDSAFRIPGTRIRFGYDALLGLVPGVGDVAALAPAAYILKKSHGHGVPTSGLVRMAANIAIDVAIGSIPLIGDLFDVGFKANRRNVAHLRAHLERTGRIATPDAKRAAQSARPLSG